MSTKTLQDDGRGGIIWGIGYRQGKAGTEARYKGLVLACYGVMNLLRGYAIDHEQCALILEQALADIERG